MRPTFDITGLRSGRLVALRRVESAGKAARWAARCDCGAEIITTCSKLRTGHTKSCGCLKRELIGDRQRKHGAKGERLYAIWMKMRSRCNNPNQPMYHRYGARGITVCPEWDDYAAFKRWALGNGYRDDLTIERDDNSLGYSPKNCRWIPMSEQAGNRDMNVTVEYGGKTQCIAYHARDMGLDPKTVRARLARGLTVAEALETPLDIKQSENAQGRR